uniref:Uncharacterized protein n=1 Tax=Trichobilharzia regenti TaxID=157069 RepID=A0AA85JND9_TRIRE|nr:unnamed protein product [Trichobilharzia regenti]
MVRSISDGQGNLIFTKVERKIKQWVDHLERLLNRLSTSTRREVPRRTALRELPVDSNPPRKSELLNAIKWRLKVSGAGSSSSTRQISSGNTETSRETIADMLTSLLHNFGKEGRKDEREDTY